MITSFTSRARLATFAVATMVTLLPVIARADSLPSGERVNGQAVIEPAYDDSTGSIVYLLTPSRLAPLSPNNPINNVNPHAVAPLYLIVYPPGTSWTFNCMGASPGNCPDHAGTVAGIATSLFPGVYGSDPAAVPGHDHLVGVAKTGGDFNVPWRVFLEFFTSTSAVSHITTLAEFQAAWNHGDLMEVDTGITFVCAVVSASTYLAGTPAG